MPNSAVSVVIPLFREWTTDSAAGTSIYSSKAMSLSNSGFGIRSKL